MPSIGNETDYAEIRTAHQKAGTGRGRHMKACFPVPGEMSAGGRVEDSADNC